MTRGLRPALADTPSHARALAKRLRSALAASGLMVRKRMPIPNPVGDVARAEALRRVLYPWIVIDIDETSNAYLYSKVRGEYRTLEEVAAAYGVDSAPGERLALPERFTIPELLAALAEPRSTFEIADLFGCSKTTAETWLKQLVIKGLAKRRRVRKSNDSKSQPLFVYQAVRASEQARKKRAVDFVGQRRVRAMFRAAQEKA